MKIKNSIFLLCILYVFFSSAKNLNNDNNKHRCKKYEEQIITKIKLGLRLKFENCKYN